MKIMDYVHKIPDALIVFIIAIWITILLVYFIATIKSLKSQVELLQNQQIERTEMILKRARTERIEDMTEFFNTNNIYVKNKN